MNTSDAVQERQSQIAENMMKLNEFCDVLHKSISDLEKRLASVLRDQEPGKTVEEKSPILVDLARQINERSTNVQYAYQRITDICRRLEL